MTETVQPTNPQVLLSYLYRSFLIPNTPTGCPTNALLILIMPYRMWGSDMHSHDEGDQIWRGQGETKGVRSVDKLLKSPG